MSGHVFHADCFAEQVREALINSDQYATKADLTRIKCSVCHDKMNTLHLRPPQIFEEEDIVSDLENQNGFEFEDFGGALRIQNMASVEEEQSHDCNISSVED